MGAALALKRGKYKGKPSKKLQELADSMSEKDLRDFAKKAEFEEGLEKLAWAITGGNAKRYKALLSSLNNWARKGQAEGAGFMSRGRGWVADKVGKGIRKYNRFVRGKDVSKTTKGMTSFMHTRAKELRRLAEDSSKGVGGLADDVYHRVVNATPLGLFGVHSPVDDVALKGMSNADKLRHFADKLDEAGHSMLRNAQADTGHLNKTMLALGVLPPVVSTGVGMTMGKSGEALEKEAGPLVQKIVDWINKLRADKEKSKPIPAPMPVNDDEGMAEDKEALYKEAISAEVVRNAIAKRAKWQRMWQKILKTEAAGAMRYADDPKLMAKLERTSPYLVKDMNAQQLQNFLAQTAEQVGQQAGRGKLGNEQMPKIIRQLLNREQIGKNLRLRPKAERMGTHIPKSVAPPKGKYDQVFTMPGKGDEVFAARLKPGPKGTMHTEWSGLANTAYQDLQTPLSVQHFQKILDAPPGTALAAKRKSLFKELIEAGMGDDLMELDPSELGKLVADFNSRNAPPSLRNMASTLNRATKHMPLESGILTQPGHPQVAGLYGGLGFRPVVTDTGGALFRPGGLRKDLPGINHFEQVIGASPGDLIRKSREVDDIVNLNKMLDRGIKVNPKKLRAGLVPEEVANLSSNLQEPRLKETVQRVRDAAGKEMTMHNRALHLYDEPVADDVFTRIFRGDSRLPKNVTPEGVVKSGMDKSALDWARGIDDVWGAIRRALSARRLRHANQKMSKMWRKAEKTIGAGGELDKASLRNAVADKLKNDPKYWEQFREAGKGLGATGLAYGTLGAAGYGAYKGLSGDEKEAMDKEAARGEMLKKLTDLIDQGRIGNLPHEILKRLGLRSVPTGKQVAKAIRDKYRVSNTGKVTSTGKAVFTPSGKVEKVLSSGLVEPTGVMQGREDLGEIAKVLFDHMKVQSGKKPLFRKPPMAKAANVLGGLTDDVARVVGSLGDDAGRAVGSLSDDAARAQLDKILTAWADKGDDAALRILQSGQGQSDDAQRIIKEMREKLSRQADELNRTHSARAQAVQEARYSGQRADDLTKSVEEMAKSLDDANKAHLDLGNRYRDTTAELGGVRDSLNRYQKYTPYMLGGAALGGTGLGIGGTKLVDALGED